MTILFLIATDESVRKTTSYLKWTKWPQKLPVCRMELSPKFSCSRPSCYQKTIRRNTCTLVKIYPKGVQTHQEQLSNQEQTGSMDSHCCNGRLPKNKTKQKIKKQKQTENRTNNGVINIIVIKVWTCVLYSHGKIRLVQWLRCKNIDSPP